MLLQLSKQLGSKRVALIFLDRAWSGLLTIIILQTDGTSLEEASHTDEVGGIASL